MKGIYKITTPSGYVYIGQSINLKNRWKEHRQHCKRVTSAIARSLCKYGWASHTFEIIHELPEDVDKKTMCEYESFYMSLYRETGLTILNLADVRGSNYGFKHSAEMRRANSERGKGRTSAWKGQKHTEETKKIMSEKAKARIRKKGYKRVGFISWNKGLKIGDIGKRKGFIVSEETREKLRIAGTGKKLSPETIAKRTASLKENKKIKHALS